MATRASIAAAAERHDALAEQARRVRTTEQRIASLEATVADLMGLVYEQRDQLAALKAAQGVAA